MSRSYDRLRRWATKGPLKAVKYTKEGDFYLIAKERRLTQSILGDDQDLIDNCLLAHRWNHFDEVVEALKLVHKDMMRRKGINPTLEMSTQIAVEQALANSAKVKMFKWVPPSTLPSAS